MHKRTYFKKSASAQMSFYIWSKKKPQSTVTAVLEKRINNLERSYKIKIVIQFMAPQLSKLRNLANS